MIIKCPRCNEEMKETEKNGIMLLHCTECGLYIEK